MNKLIIVIENNEETIFVIRYSLIKEGFTVKSAPDGISGLRIIREEIPDLVILNQILPDINGMEVCREIRLDHSIAHIPVIILTRKAKGPDGMLGLEQEADDYIVEPFSSREIRAKVKRLLKQIHQRKDIRSKLFYKNIVMDTAACTLKEGEKAIKLTPKEFKLLDYLIRNKGNVVSREVILDSIWNIADDEFVTTRTVDTHIWNLRKKIPILANSIVTVKQFGYKLEED